MRIDFESGFVSDLRDQGKQKVSHMVHDDKAKVKQQ